MKCQHCGAEVVWGFALLKKKLAERLLKFLTKYEPPKVKKPVVQEVSKKVKKVSTKKKSSVRVCSAVKKLQKYLKESPDGVSDAAKALGVDTTTIYNWFNGVNKPWKKNRDQIKRFLKSRNTEKKTFNPWDGLTPEQEAERKQKISIGKKVSNLKKQKEENERRRKSLVPSNPDFQRAREDTIRREKELDAQLKKLGMEHPSFHFSGNGKK